MRYLGVVVLIAFVVGFAAVAADEEGYVSLFNGKDMTGWKGDTKGYAVEDGKMVCKPGGNIHTEKEYANFSFKFEFKLPPGGNNGVGIRSDFSGNPAYEGMEIQILDDRNEKYKDLKEWQVHGSIYGVVPAKRDSLKPVGEWNTEEIIADGPKIKVIVNGTTVVDANLDEVKGPVDGHEHPGLRNPKGYIGFLGHGDVIEFRNVRIKEIK